MGCEVGDHAKEDPDWGNENAEKLCGKYGECGTCPFYYSDAKKSAKRRRY